MTESAAIESSVGATKILVLVNDPPYGTERCYNALRLAGMTDWTLWADRVVTF